MNFGKILIKIILPLIFLLIFVFFDVSSTSAQTCGGSGRCGTFVGEICTLNDGSTCSKGQPGCLCSDPFCDYSSTTTYSCSYNSGVGACTPNYPPAPPVTECNAGGCGQNNCTTTYATCDTGAVCGPWNVECGTASRTCTYTTYSGGGSCIQNNFTDYDTIACPVGEYCTPSQACLSYGYIVGKVVKDYNHNGIKDGGDEFYDSPGSPISLAGPTTAGSPHGTNATGDYSFTNLTFGSYTVTLAVPANYQIVNTNPKTVTVNGTTVTVNFYITPIYTIDLGAYVDTDNNLTETTAYPHGAERAYGGGLLVKLMQAGAEVRRVTTGTNGQGVITGVVSGDNYRLVFDTPGGYEFRLPTSAGCSPPSCRGTVTDPANFSTTSLGNNISRDYIFTELYNISGTVHRSTITGAGYAGGAPVSLKQSGSTLATVTTNGSGNYTFTDYLPGTYTVGLDVPNGWKGIPQPLVNPTQTCSPPNCEGVVNDPTTIGPDKNNVDFVITSIQNCSVTGSVKTTAGAAVPGVLLNLSGDAAATDTSDTTTGNFSFGSYQDGTGLTVTLATNTLPANYTITNGGAARSAGVCPNSVINYIIDDTFDIGDHVFIDNNGDGARNGADSWWNSPGSPLALAGGPTSKPNTGTDASGYYLFRDLAVGTYRVTLTVPAGYEATSSNPNFTCAPINCRGNATITNITIGPDDLTNDFGLHPLPTPPIIPPGCNFVGTVYVDTNFDNVGDRPYGTGATINLRHGSTLDDTDDTDTGGNYALNTSNPNTYRVQLDIPSGYQAVSTNPVINLICPASLNTTITRDFVIRIPGCQISGNVYTDTNGNSVRDGGESGISGTTVTIKRGGVVVTSPTTNVAGSYATTQTTGYSYTVSVTEPSDTDISTPPNPKTVVVCPDATANFGFTPVPKGYLDTATCNNWTGWTCDASNYNTSLSVHFYANGPAGTGTLIATTVASNSRSDLGGVCGGVLTHGFNYTPIPASLKDGQNHTIYAYGIDTPTGNYNPLLIGSPKTINCPPLSSIVSVPPNCTINPDAVSCPTTITWNYTAPAANVCETTPGNPASVFALGGTPGTNHSQGAAITATTHTFTVRASASACTGPIIGTATAVGTKTYKISGRVYVDNNGNGVFDGTDSNYTGAQLTVRNSGGTTVSSPTTSGAGVTNYTTYPPTMLNAGTYNVTLTAPAGYAITTPSTPPSPPNQKSVTLGPNAVVNFGIRPSYNVVATAQVDNNLDNCATGATTYNQSAVSFSLTDTTLGSTVNSGAKNPATHTFSSVLLNPQQLSMSVPTGFRISGITGAPVAGSRVGNSLNFTPTSNETVDFCITDAVAWYQTADGDVRLPRIVNKVPVGKAAGESGNSVFFSSSLTADFGQGGTAPGSQNKWKIDNEYTTTNSGAKNALGSFSYDFYLDRAAKNGLTVQNLSSVESQCVPGGTCTLPVIATGIYKVDGDLTINGSAAQSNHVVILVNGNTTITGDISTSGNGLFILATKQDLTINKTVGTAVSSTTPQLSGFFSAQDSIVIDGDGTAACSSGTGDLRLNVEGSLIANSLYPFANNSAGGSIQNNRSLCTNDDTYPAFYVAMKPSFFTQLTDFYKVTNKRWMQVQP